MMADTLQGLPSGAVNPRVLRERLAAWDSKTQPKAPLTDAQKDVFIDLSTQVASKPLPIELPLDDTPCLPTRLTPPTSPVGKEWVAGFFSYGPQEEKAKIENAQQFFSWFAELEDQIQTEEESSYSGYTEELEAYRDKCNEVLQEVSDALEHLKQLQANYVFVSTKTSALHEACEHLLADQTQLMDVAESISNKLSYFNELERISSKLGSPQLTVTNESFVPMLSRLDECVLYLQSNPRFKESSVYLARFKQCLSKALNLIKIHVVTILQNATQQVTPKKESGGNAENAFTLFYGKFRANAPRVKALMEQIEQRTNKSPQYEQLLADCHQCYFTQRQTLLGPSVANAIADLASKHARDHCALMRSGCAFMVHVCEDEHQLFFNFFSRFAPELDEMLEKLCNNLYDVFRPLIIHINHLETLAELCSILKVEMIEEHVKNNSDQLRAFESVCLQMLMDVQERLVYRTYIYIRSDILNYAPATGDLAYPEKLEMMEKIAESLSKPNKGSHSRNASAGSAASLEVAQITEGATDPPAQENGTKTVENGVGPFAGSHSNMPMSPADLHGMWYPTVRRTLVCLSKLYRCIDKTTFQGLSQETLSMCIDSLKTAKAGITARKTTLDGQLFLIKHLLILREQIAPFHADFSIRETSLDFSKFRELREHATLSHMWDAAYGLFQKKSQLFALNSTNALLQLILEGTPQVTENFVDSKKDVDNQLKKTCEEFIHDVSDQCLGPMKNFLTRADVIVTVKKVEGTRQLSLSRQPFAAPEKVQDVVAETYKIIKTKVPVIKRSMALYLANRDTESILFKPIKGHLLQTFQQMGQLLQENYSEEDRQIVGCPTPEQMNLLLASSGK
ncbi:conserved oligomeric Golgi complex subunit 3-like [Liolophura sinensis]|uniref:conserved oligomeric Golgi complex subunit 3-like n=1 Tax=Liolophura sinensis TaxID=3198878 RepID=UPI003158500E